MCPEVSFGGKTLFMKFFCLVHVCMDFERREIGTLTKINTALCHRKILRSGSLKKTNFLVFCQSFPTLSKKFWNIFGYFPAGLSKLHSKSPDVHFQEEYSCWKFSFLMFSFKFIIFWNLISRILKLRPKYFSSLSRLNSTCGAGHFHS